MVNLGKGFVMITVFLSTKLVVVNTKIPFHSKATTLERTYGPAWIAYGHSFAVESEHDQAMAAYFTAAQLMKGFVNLVVLVTIIFTRTRIFASSMTCVF